MLKELCYNGFEVIAMSTKVEQLIRELQHLSEDELKVLCKVILKQLAVPLQDPEQMYDDWNDPEVDASYAETW